jgi:hypothetical protein
LGTPGGKEPTPAPKYEPRPKFDGGKTGVPGVGTQAKGPELGQMHAVAARRGDQQVIAITLDGRLTSGFDADDNRPGDEGIVVAVEARNAAGETLRVPGEVFIIAYDMNLLRQYVSQPDKRHLAHVGTWQFTSQDAATWFDEDQDRMRFELPWPPAGGPRSKDLRVVVKYKTADGRVLEASSHVAVQLSGQRAKFPSAAPPPTAPLGGSPRGSASSPTPVPGEFSALKRPSAPVAADVPPAPASAQPRSADLVPRHDVSDARPGTQVPSRQRPVWAPYR